MAAQPHSWIIQVPGGPHYMTALTAALEQCRAECHPATTRRGVLDVLLTGCRQAKRIGTGGTDGTDAP
jgi:hypothetical protein